MDIFQWFLGQSESAIAIKNQHLNVNSNIFFAYTILCIFIKKPAYLLAFFMSAMLFEMRLFDPVLESDLYLITFAIYSYVFTNCKTVKSKFGCGILIVLSIALAVDAAFFGEYGYYGATETFLYRNIEYLSLYAHCIFIATLVDHKRIWNSLRNFIDTIMHISRTSAYF